MVPCIVRPLSVLFLLAGACLVATAVTPSHAEEEPDPDAAKFETIVRADTMVPMRDGAGLATDFNLPKDRDGLFPVIFVKTPYDFNRIEGAQLEWGIEAIERGYACVLQNERGHHSPRHASRIVLPVVRSAD